MARFVIRHFTPPPPPSVRVNLNAISEDGLVRVDGADFDRPVTAGSLVRIFEPVDEIEGYATVARVNDRTGLMYLDVVWESLRDLESIHVISTSDVEAIPATPSRHIGPPGRLDRPQLLSASR
jgi:hypothetical protein